MVKSRNFVDSDIYPKDMFSGTSRDAVEFAYREFFGRWRRKDDVKKALVLESLHEKTKQNEEIRAYWKLYHALRPLDNLQEIMRAGLLENAFSNIDSAFKRMTVSEKSYLSKKFAKPTSIKKGKLRRKKGEGDEKYLARLKRLLAKWMNLFGKVKKELKLDKKPHGNIETAVRFLKNEDITGKCYLVESKNTQYINGRWGIAFRANVKPFIDRYRQLYRIKHHQTYRDLLEDRWVDDISHGYPKYDQRTLKKYKNFEAYKKDRRRHYMEFEEFILSIFEDEALRQYVNSSDVYNSVRDILIAMHRGTRAMQSVVEEQVEPKMLAYLQRLKYIDEKTVRKVMGLIRSEDRDSVYRILVAFVLTNTYSNFVNGLYGDEASLEGMVETDLTHLWLYRYRKKEEIKNKKKD